MHNKEPTMRHLPTPSTISGKAVSEVESDKTEAAAATETDPIAQVETDEKLSGLTTQSVSKLDLKYYLETVYGVLSSPMIKRSEKSAFS